MYKVASLYKFSVILNPFKTHNDIRSKFKELSIIGTILVGEEGINGTISSSNNKDLIKAINYIKAIKGFDHLDVKYSVSEKKPFIRMKVKLKEEIVSMGISTINPNHQAGE